MLNSCFRFRCAIVQAGTVVIFPPYHPPSQAPPSLCGPLVFWQHSFRQNLLPATRTTRVVRFEAFLAWLFGKLFSNKFLLHFGVQFECGLHVNARQTGLPGLPASTLFTVKLLPNCATIVISGCRATMYDVVGCAIAQTCRCGCLVERNLSMNYGISTWCCWHFECWTNSLLHPMNSNWNQFYLEQIEEI